MSSGIGNDLIFRTGEAQHIISHVSSYDDPTDSAADLWISEPGKDNISIDCASGKAKFNPAVIKAERREMSEGTPSL